MLRVLDSLRDIYCLNMSIIKYNVPVWIMIAVTGALLDLCAVYMIKDKRPQKKSIAGGIAVFLAGTAILAVGVFLLVIGKSGTFSSYI